MSRERVLSITMPPVRPPLTSVLPSMVCTVPSRLTFTTSPMWLKLKIASEPTRGLELYRPRFLYQSRTAKTLAALGKIEVGIPAFWKHHHWKTTHHA